MTKKAFDKIKAGLLDVPNAVAWQAPSGAKARISVKAERKPGKKITAEQYALTLTEHAQQVAVFIWASEPETVAAIPEIVWLHAIPNGGERHIAVATRMVAEGSKSGVYDIFWPLYRAGHFNGLYLEMKRPASVGTNGKKKKAGILSEKQEQFRDYVRDHGFCTREAWTYAEAREIIISYYRNGY